MPNQKRELSRIDSHLRDTLRELAKGNGRWPLFLIGKPGCGKTSAALALLDYVEGETIYHTIRSLLRTTTDARFGRLQNTRGYDVTESGYWKIVERCELTVIDELACHVRTTDVEMDAIMEWCDARQHRPSIAISNIGPEAMEKIYDARIVSRMTSGTVIELDSDDRRLE